MAVWGLSWTNAKILGYYGDAQLMMFWRFTIATLSFAPIVYYTKNSFSLNIKSFRFIALNAIFMTSYNYFYFKGTQIGLAGAGGVLRGGHHRDKRRRGASGQGVGPHIGDRSMAQVGRCGARGGGRGSYDPRRRSHPECGG